MNYFEFYPGDYLRDTARLKLVEHGAYLKLMLAYYGEEEPLPADYGDLYQIANAQSAPEKEAVRKVADKYFSIDSDGLRHNKRADEVIALAQTRIEAAPEKKANEAERQRRHRERRAGLFDQLRAVGISPKFSTTTADLESLVTAYVTCDSRNESRDSNAHVTPSHTATRPQTPDPTSKASQDQEPINPPITPELEATERGRACLLMRSAGCVRTNPSHAELVRAIALGITPETLAHFAQAASDKGKSDPFAYAITAAINAHAGGTPHSGDAHVTPHHGSNGSAGGKLSAPDQVGKHILDARAKRRATVPG